MPPTLCAIDELLRDSPQLWRGRQLAALPARATGFAALDAQLPGAGWPIGALIEIAPACAGLGELSLLLPALQRCCEEGRSIAFVRPPYTPYAPALARCGLPLPRLLWIAAARDEDAHWAAEQLLREGAAAVLLWSPIMADRALRRLQLAAEAGQACAFLYRTPAQLRSSSPAALRLALSPAEDGVQVRIVKARGGHASGPVTLSLHTPFT
ncbi:MAG TPA: translesion DNA synthesis-associated protein ImuA [Steroidobacteraceae bacterium]